MSSKTEPTSYGVQMKTPRTERCICRFCHDDLSTKRGKKAILIKILILAVIPVITLLIQGAIIVHDDLKMIKLEKDVEDDLQFNVDLGVVVHNLQMEKDMSSLYLTTGNASVYSDLKTYRQNTDRSVRALTKWITLETPDHRFPSKEIFLEHIHEKRVEVDILNVSNDEVLEEYSEDHEALLKLIGNIIKDANFGEAKKWQPIVAYHMLLLSKGEAGTERAIGSMYYGTGKV